MQLRLSKAIRVNWVVPWLLNGLDGLSEKCLPEFGRQNIVDDRVGNAVQEIDDLDRVGYCIDQIDILDHSLEEVVHIGPQKKDAQWQ